MSTYPPRTVDMSQEDVLGSSSVRNLTSWHMAWHSPLLSWLAEDQMHQPKRQATLIWIRSQHFYYSTPYLEPQNIATWRAQVPQLVKTARWRGHLSEVSVLITFVKR